MSIYDRLKRVTLKKDIRIASIPQANGGGQTKSGWVLLESLLGRKRFISRQDFIKMYTYRDGSKIRIPSMRTGEKYFVARDINMSIYVAQVKKKSGETAYLVSGSTRDGELNLGAGVYIIDEDIFNETFEIEEAVEELAVGGMGGMREVPREPLGAAHKAGNGLPEMGDTDVMAGGGSLGDGVGSSRSRSREQPDEPTKVQVAVVGKLVQGRETVGFLTARSDQPDKVYKVTKSQLASMAKSGRVANVGVRNLNGKDYIHGIGMRIKDLREYAINQ